MNKTKVNQSKRNSAKALAALGLVSVALPSRWTTPVLNSLVLPAHAQTSFGGQCTGPIETESVNEPISLVVNSADVIGPITAPRTGSSFSAVVSSSAGTCGPNNDELTQEIELTGTIESAQNQIVGTFIVRQFCGGELACEQLTDYTADQVIPVSGDDLGEYRGRVIGTLTCCTDFT